MDPKEEGFEVKISLVWESKVGFSIMEFRNTNNLDRMKLDFTYKNITRFKINK